MGLTVRIRIWIRIGSYNELLGVTEDMEFGRAAGHMLATMIPPFI